MDPQVHLGNEEAEGDSVLRSRRIERQEAQPDGGDRVPRIGEGFQEATGGWP